MSDLSEFVLARWALLTEPTPARQFQDQTGISTNTLAKEPGLVRPDAQLRIATLLRFASWRDLENALKDWEVGRDIVIKVDAKAYEKAKGAAGTSDVDDWVSRAIIRQAEVESKGEGK